MKNKINCKNTNVSAAAYNLSISAIGKGNRANAIILIFLLMIALLPGCLSGGGGDASVPTSAGQPSLIISGSVVPAGSLSTPASAGEAPDGQIGGITAGAAGVSQYIISLAGIDGRPLPAAAITQTNTAFTAAIPLDENINYAVIIVKDGVTNKTLYKSLPGRVPKLSEIAAAGDIAVKNVIIDSYSTARTLLALENINAVPQTPIAIESITLDAADAAKNKTAFEKELESKLGAANISEFKKAVAIISSAISDSELNAALNYSGNDECKTVYKNFIDILKSSFEQSPKFTAATASKIKRIISEAGVDASLGISVNGETINKDSSADKINNPPVISGVTALPAAGIITVRYGLFHADADKCSLKVYLVSETSEMLITSDRLSGDISGLTPGADKTMVINIASYDGLDRAAAYKIKLVPYDDKASGVFDYSQIFSLSPAAGAKSAVSKITLQSSNISGDTEVNYNLYAENNLNCDMKIYYSINYAGTTEINAADISGDIKNVTPAALKKILWKSKNSLPGEIKNVRLIIAPQTAGGPGAECVSPAFNILNPVSFVKTFEYSPKTVVLPEKRYGHTGVADSADNMWIIGGGSGYGAFDDIWTRAAGSGQWNRVTAAVNGGRKFNARSYHSAAIDSNNTIWITGGLIDDKTATNEVWRFNTASSVLELINTTGEVYSARHSHSSAIDAAGNLWVIGGGGDTVSNEVWRLNTGTLQWSKIEAGGGEFTPGYARACAIGKDNKIWLFGGFDSSNQRCDEIWRFDTAGFLWEKISAAAGAPPAALSAYQACAMGGNGKIYITGGQSSVNDSKGNNKILSFDTGNNSLTEITVQSDLFIARYSHISVIDSKNKIYIMGGRGNNNYNDTWYSEDFGVTWKNPAADRSNPCPRSRHSSVVTDSGRLFIIGGTDGGGNYLSDVWYSDDAGASWIEASKNTPYNKKIIARMSHTSLLYQGKLYIIGGMGHKGVLNDVMRSDDNGASWTDITAASAANRKFSARAGHSSVIDGNGKLWIIGGYRYIFNDRASDDYSDSWVSEDLGTSWTQVNPGIQTILKSPAAQSDSDIIYSAFMPTSAHTSVIDKNGTIYIIGGGSPHTWFSFDGGAKWQKKNVATPEFSMRKQHCGAIDKSGRTYVIGGRDTINACMNDAWYTTDFSNWIMLKETAFASPRSGHASCTDKNGRVYITGGTGYNDEPVNDMCYYFEL